MPGRGGTHDIICPPPVRPDGIEWSWEPVLEPCNRKTTLMFMIKNCKLNLLDEFTCDPSARVGEGFDDCPDVRYMMMGGCGKGGMSYLFPTPLYACK
jgi:hypothetical protein